MSEQQIFSECALTMTARRLDCEMRKNIYSMILLCIAVLAVWLAPRIAGEDIERSRYEFVKVVDGDTLIIVHEGTDVKVRLIGVDAPESVHPDESQNTDAGVRASEQLARMLDGSDGVYLEFDEEQYDAYDRLLAYVYLAEDVSFEESLNYRMVSEGYAVNKEYKPNVRYARELETACKEAKESGRGLWKENNKI